MHGQMRRTEHQIVQQADNLVLCCQYLKTWYHVLLWGSLVETQACKDVCKVDANLHCTQLL